jgi:ParB-like nuclease domain
MDFENNGRRTGGRSVTHQLKAKSLRRRQELERLRTPTPSYAPRNDPLPNLDLVFVPLEDLRLPSRVIRKLEAAHVHEVASAISTLGFCAPVLIGKDNAVIDGAIRVHAARQLGLDRVPCVRVEHLSEVEQRVLRLAINRLGEKGEWNLDELKIEFEELIFADAPIEVSGSRSTRSITSLSTRLMMRWRRGLSRPTPALSPSPALATSLTSVPTGSFAAAQLILRPSAK